MKRLFPLFAILLVVCLASCGQMAPIDEAAYEAQLNADFENVMASLGTKDAARVFADFDAKYDTNLTSDFAAQLLRPKLGKDSDYPALTAMPFNTDGAVYLSGGGEGLVSNVIGWVAPKTYTGNFYHGAVLDLDKYDPNDESQLCLESAITKGAGYETAEGWRHNVNVCVMNPTISLNKSRLDAAQAYMDYYCDPNFTNQKYGFFKNYVDIFNVVTKEDSYYWYCTKVVWKVYERYGIDIDSNSNLNFENSGLYSLVNAYYKARYFYSSSKAKKAIADYIADARQKIVLAEEIMDSPYFRTVYKVIREN